MEVVPSLPVPYYAQLDDYSCGAACLKMVFEYNGIVVGIDELVRQVHTKEEDGPLGGAQEEDLVAVAAAYGATVTAKEGASIQDIISHLQQSQPVIIGYLFTEEGGQLNGHFVTVVGATQDDLLVHDPWGKPNSPLPRDYLEKHWTAESGKVNRWMMTIQATKKEP